MRQPQPWDQVVTSMQQVNPLVIPRNYAVEFALQQAETGDYGPFHKLLTVLQQPFLQIANTSEYLYQSSDSETTPYRTFCGT